MKASGSKSPISPCGPRVELRWTAPDPDLQGELITDSTAQIYSTLLCITSRQPDRFSSEQASDESERNISSTDHHQAGVDLSASYASRSVCEALDLTCLICRDLHQTQDTVYCKHWDLGSFSVMLCKLLGINILSSTNSHSHPFTIIFHKHKPEY